MFRQRGDARHGKGIIQYQVSLKKHLIITFLKYNKSFKQTFNLLMNVFTPIYIY